MIKFAAFSVAVLLVIQSSLFGQTFVSSADDIENAMQTAQPGDTLIMTNGVWNSQEIDFVGMGAPDNPITLRAQTPGGVVLTGVSQLRISGDHLVVDGLHFKDGTIENSDHVVQFRGPLGEATNSRFTNSVIESYSGPDLNDKYHYVSLYGQNNRIDNNRFLDQRNIGPQVVAWLDESANPVSAFHRIDGNHFGDRPQGWDNGFEAIRLGDSETSHVDAHITVENNLFERVDGEIEIISSKSNFNVFRNNTFRQSKVTLTLRHGNSNTVEGNFFLGEDTEDSGGIRVVGQDHRIVNNYLANVGDAADGAISFAAGIPNTQPNGYLQVRDVVLAHNTIVDVEGSAVTFDWGIGSGGRSLLPEDLTINGNLISSTGTQLFEGAQGSGYTFADNIAHGAALGIGSRPGILDVNPQLVQDAEGVWRISSSSPAIDGAAVSLLFNDDMDGQARIGLYDIGADELSTAAILRQPLTTDTAGASWFDYQPPTQWPLPPTLPPGEFVVLEAEGFASITDPDQDGDIWTVLSVEDASQGAVIKAPDGSRTNLPGTHDTLALYDVVFDEEGDYTAYYLARGFDGSSDSFYRADDFGTDPDVTENISSNGSFRWEIGEDFSIDASQVGSPLELRVGRREGGAEIDVILFHENGSLTANQLESILLSLSSEPCDFDGDGICDASDINSLMAEIAAGSDDVAFDMNGDGVVDVLDRDAWLVDAGELNIGSPYLTGDANLDGAVDVSDFNLWNENKFSTTSRWDFGEFSGDGAIDASDFNIWNSNKFTFSDQVVAVPEPALGMWFLAIGFLILRRNNLRA